MHSIGQKKLIGYQKVYIYIPFHYISIKDEEDIYWYAYMLQTTGQYKRAYFILSNVKNIQKKTRCWYLKAVALFETKEYKEALELLEEDLLSENSFNSTFNPYEQLDQKQLGYDMDIKQNINMESLVFLLKGKIYQAMDCFEIAKKHFLLSLYHDITNHEALEILIKYCFIKEKESEHLLKKILDELNKELPINKDNKTFKQMILIIYKKQFGLDKVDLNIKNENPDIKVITDFDQEIHKAKKLFYSCFFEECYDLLKELLKVDKFNADTLTLCISCHYQMNNIKGK
ncbi:unnamed protein product [Gordionus sp. m RMFG-2023]